MIWRNRAESGLTAAVRRAGMSGLPERAWFCNHGAPDRDTAGGEPNIRPLPLGAPRVLPSPALLGAAALALLYGAFLIARSPPMLGTDYWWWIAEAQRIDDLLLGRGCGDYMLKPYPVPNAMTSAALALAMPAVGWRAAAEGWLAGYLAFLPACAWRLQRATGREDAAPLLFAVVAIGLGALFWSGCANYCLSLGLVMLGAAWFLEDRLTPRRVLWLSLAAFLCHAIGFGFIAGLALLERRRPAAWLALAPGLLLTGWYMVGRFLLGGDAELPLPHGDNPPFLGAAFVATKLNTVLKLGGLSNFYVAAGEQRIYVAQHLFGWGFPMLGLALAATVSGLLVWRWAGSLGGDDRRARLLRYASLVALAALLVPRNLLGVIAFDFRLLAMAALVAAFLVRWEGWPGRILTAGLATLGAMNAAVLLSLGPPGSDLDATRPVLTGTMLDRVLLDFSHAPLALDTFGAAAALDADRCLGKAGDFTGLILPRR